MDNPETQATYSTLDTGQMHAKEHRRDNQEWTIHRHRQHIVHQTQDKCMLKNTEGTTKNGQSIDTGNI